MTTKQKAITVSTIDEDNLSFVNNVLSQNNNRLFLVVAPQSVYQNKFDKKKIDVVLDDDTIEQLEKLDVFLSEKLKADDVEYSPIIKKHLSWKLSCDYKPDMNTIKMIITPTDIWNWKGKTGIIIEVVGMKQEPMKKKEKVTDNFIINWD